MSSDEKKPESAPSPTGEPDDTPRNTIRVIKSGDSDDTVVEVKVAGESEAKVTVFGGESTKNEKQEHQVTTTPNENEKKETISNEDEQTKVDDTKECKYSDARKPLSQDEIDEIVKQYAKMDEKDLKKYLDFFWTVDDNKLGFFTIQQLAYHLHVRGCYYSTTQIAVSIRQHIR